MLPVIFLQVHFQGTLKEAMKKQLRGQGSVTITTYSKSIHTLLVTCFAIRQSTAPINPRNTNDRRSWEKRSLDGEEKQR